MSAAGSPDPSHDRSAPARLTSPRVVRELLERHGLRAERSFGQHFLIDDAVLAGVVEAAGVRPGDEAWEVGPGLGVLTLELARIAERVRTVELDRRIAAVARETLAGHGDVEVIEADATTFDFGRAAAGSVFAANLPYNVGTGVLVRVLESGRFRQAGVLLQREVAERLRAGPGSKAYGALSLVVAHFGEARIVRTVAPGAFLPPPEVTSAVVRIDLREGVTPDETTFALVRAGFRHRRKTLARNLRMAGLDEDDVADALQGAGLSPLVRAEALDLDAFRALAARLPQVATAGRQEGAILGRTRRRGTPR